MAATQSFNDWNSVAQYYGPQIANQLQQSNVPLSQVGQTIAQADPNFFQGGSFPSGGFQPGGSDPGNSSINNSPFGFTQLGGNQGLLQALGQGGGQQQQGPSFDPTKNPNYPTSLLGAQALNAVGLNPNKQVITNPSPANTPTSSDFAKSGVSAVSSPQTTTYTDANPQTSVPSIFSPATTYQPTGGGQIQPTQQFNAASFQGPAGGGTPYAAVPQVSSPRPPAAPNTLPPPPGISGGTPGANYTANETNVVPGPISGLSPTATPPGPAALPPGFGGGAEVKHMAGGGQVGARNTDTVPAMLTPGEYVINRNAAQQIGRGRLDQLNSEGRSPLHMQSGGSIPGASPSYFPGGGSSYGMGAGDPNQQSSDAQSYAFGQLSPSEQVQLQGGNAQAQAKYNQLVNSYQGSSGSPTPMSAQMGSIARPTAMAQVHPTAPAAPANAPQRQQQPGYSGSLDQWLAQYGHTPQGQAYIAQNGNVGEVQRYLQNLTTPQQTSPQSPAYGYAPRASLVSPPANYGAAPRAQLVGLPPGQGEAYDPKTYGINPGASTPNIAGGIASGIGQIGSAIAGLFSKGGGQPYKPIPSAIPSPSDFKSQTPDIVLQGHQVGQPNVPGGYVLMAQPHDQGSGYPQSPYGANLS